MLSHPPRPPRTRRCGSELEAGDHRDVNSRVVAPTPRRSRSASRPVDERAETAPASVSPRPRAEPVLEHHRGGEQHAARVDDAAAGESRSRRRARGTKRLGPCSASSPCAATRACGARRSPPAAPPAGATATTSKRLALNAASGSASRGRDARRERGRVHRDGVDEVVPGASPTTASPCCAPRRPKARRAPTPGTSSSSGDENRRRVQTERHAPRRARRSSSPSALQTRLSARDEHGVGGEHRSPRRCEKACPPRARGDAANGDVQPPRARDRAGARPPRARGSASAISSGAEPRRQAGDCRPMAHQRPPRGTASSRVTAGAGVGERLETVERGL